MGLIHYISSRLDNNYSQAQVKRKAVVIQWLQQALFSYSPVPSSRNYYNTTCSIVGDVERSRVRHESGRPHGNRTIAPHTTILPFVVEPAAFSVLHLQPCPLVVSHGIGLRQLRLP